MTEAKSGFPRRDADGRIMHLPDLLGQALAGVVIGVLALVLFDGLFALLGMGEFGRANGWLAVILPAWLFVEEFRAWRGGPARIIAALVGVAIGFAVAFLAVGLIAGALSDPLAPLVQGALAATVFALTYAVIWFYGVRWLARREGNST